MLYDPLFQLCLGILILEGEEFQHERVFDSFLWRDGIAGFGNLRLLKDSGPVARERDALVKLAADLAVELANRPAGTQCLSLVKCTRFGPLDREEADVCRPGQRELGGNLWQGRGFFRLFLKNLLCRPV